MVSTRFDHRLINKGDFFKKSYHIFRRKYIGSEGPGDYLRRHTSLKLTLQEQTLSLFKKSKYIYYLFKTELSQLDIYIYIYSLYSRFHFRDNEKDFLKSICFMESILLY